MNKAWKITGAIIGIILVVVLLRGCVMTSYLIPSSGMENSLFQGERILVNKWSYGLRLPLMALWNYHRWADSPVQKEDIIVFNNPANLSEPVISRRETFISRCIGVPGDTLLIDSLFSVIPSEKNAPARIPAKIAKKKLRFPNNVSENARLAPASNIAAI